MGLGDPGDLPRLGFDRSPTSCSTQAGAIKDDHVLAGSRAWELRRLGAALPEEVKDAHRTYLRLSKFLNSSVWPLTVHLIAGIRTRLRATTYPARPSPREQSSYPGSSRPKVRRPKRPQRAFSMTARPKTRYRRPRNNQLPLWAVKTKLPKKAVLSTNSRRIPERTRADLAVSRSGAARPFSLSSPGRSRWPRWSRARQSLSSPARPPAPAK